MEFDFQKEAVRRIKDPVWEPRRLFSANEGPPGKIASPLQRSHGFLIKNAIRTTGAQRVYPDNCRFSQVSSSKHRRQSTPLWTLCAPSPERSLRCRCASTLLRSVVQSNFSWRPKKTARLGNPLPSRAAFRSLASCLGPAKSSSLRVRPDAILGGAVSAKQPDWIDVSEDSYFRPLHVSCACERSIHAPG